MNRNRSARLAGAGLSLGLLAGLTVPAVAAAAPLTVADCRSVALARDGNVELSLGTLTTGDRTVEAGAGVASALRVCWSLTADSGLVPTVTPPTITVTPMPPDPDDTRVCTGLEVGISATTAVRGSVTASITGGADASALGTTAGGSAAATLTVPVDLPTPPAQERVRARACASTTGDVSVS